MRLLTSEGAKDRASMYRVELLSNSILSNLESRVTADLLQRPDADDVLKELLLVARDLDAVRATKASTLLESAIERERKRVGAAQEQGALQHLNQVSAVLAELSQPSQLLPGALKVLELAEEASKAAPTSKVVADRLLRALIQLSNQFLKMPTAWVPNAAVARQAQDLCGRIDATASKLVVVMGAVWDPPLLPQAQQLVSNHAAQLWGLQIQAAQHEVSKDNAGGAFDALEALLPWWPYVKDSGDCSLQIIGAFSEVQTFASNGFLKATASGDTTMCEAIREFAQKFDALRAGFADLPPAGDGGLVECLTAREASGAVLKQVTLLENELAKATDDDASTTMSLAASVQALEALASLLPSLPAADEALAGRAVAACLALEGWAERTAGAVAGPRADGLLRFAEEYDRRRARFPPACEPLRPRLALRVTAGHLGSVEAELSKPAGLNPAVLLAGLRSAAAALPDGPAAEGLAVRLNQALAATERRVAESFGDAVREGAARKEQLLLVFAAGFDEVVAKTGARAAGAGAGAGTEAAHRPLVAQLQERRHASACVLIGDLEAQLATSSDLEAALVQLRGLAVAPLLEQPELLARLEALVASLRERLTTATGAAAAAGVDQALRLLDAATEADTVLAPLRASCTGGAPDAGAGAGVLSLRTLLLGPAANALLSDAEQAIQNPAGPGALECDQLAGRLRALGPLLAEPGLPEEARRRAGRLLSRLEDALAAGMLNGTPEAPLRASAAADALRPALQLAPAAEGSAEEPCGRADLCGRLRAAQAAASRLAEASAELVKPAGMNPTVVLQAIRALEPLWPQVAQWASFAGRLTEVSATFEERLVAACRKALEADAKKVQALRAFAREADEAQDALARHAAGLPRGRYVWRLAQLLASESLEAVEAELAKESGLNPATVLRGFEQLGAAWPDLARGDLAEAGRAEDAQLTSRWREAHLQVRRRIQESMKEALATGNSKKQDALLSFATGFDRACKVVPESETFGHLVDDLRRASP